ncbi:Cellulose-synthase-like c12 [Thalictrum thalictroides]|uniref:Cellulose-synthase-like c12 n=1 Tax=Thalictrum thalictroides TaxID=46969 RepID=A0A7J6V8F3_THATH|nr:Cellulose-synthase-like c12 [Thalictrum thalictroides]
MAPFDWFANEKLEGTPVVVVKMENPNWSMFELKDDLLLSCDKAREKNAKQLTSVLLLKAHKAAGCLASVASVMVGLTAAICRGVSSGRTDAC